AAGHGEWPPPAPGCAEDRAARRCLTVRTGARPRAAPSPGPAREVEPGGHAGRCPGQVMRGRRAGADQRAASHPPPSHRAAAAHRAGSTPTADPPAQGDTWVVRTTAGSGPVVVGTAVRQPVRAFA